MARIEHPLPAPAALRVQRDLATGVQDPQPPTADLDHHARADQAPRHAVGVAVDLDATVRLNPTDQLAGLLERRPAGERLQRSGLVALEPDDRRLTRRAMDPDVRHLAGPLLEMGLERRPARKLRARRSRCS